MRHLLLPAALLVGLAQAASAQAPALAAGPTLSIDDALALARRNNPVLQQTVGAERAANAALRSSYGAFLPNVDASFGTQFRQGGGSNFNGVAFGATSSTVASSYDVSVNARYNTATFTGPKLNRASVRAAEADIRGNEAQLRTDVTQQYLAVLQQQTRAALQDTLLVTTRAQLELAKAREAVGSATGLDVRRAEVQVGQQQVAALQARNQVEIEKLRLFQLMGVAQPGDAQLTSRFPVTPIELTAEGLLTMARQSNPQIAALRERETVANLSYRNAQGQYSPTLSLSTGVGGFTNQFTDDGFLISQANGGVQGNCLGDLRIREVATGAAPSPAELAACQSLSISSTQAQALRDGNSTFPFSFRRNPVQVSAFISIPVFNGFVREQRLQEAGVQRANARYITRGQELALTANVTAGYLNLTTAQRTVAMQEQNARTAREALSLAEERYRVGANTFLDVTQARADYERAETDRINAVYDYHRAFAALEGAVGRPLR